MPFCAFRAAERNGHNDEQYHQTRQDLAGYHRQAYPGARLFCVFNAQEKLWYWYGENKEKTDGKGSVWHWGVRLYT